MNCFQHHLTMPDQILLALLQADAAHLDKERRELIKLRDQVGQRKNQRQASRDCEFLLGAPITAKHLQRPR
jgi:hypothetical protein